MKGKRLDRPSIEALRKAVEDLADSGTSHLPLAKIVGHHDELAPFDRITVDFGTSTDAAPIIILRESATADPRIARLSPREQEVARLVAEGFANKQIAARLNLSIATVKDHVHHILHKLDMSNRAAIAALFGSPSDHA